MSNNGVRYQSKASSLEDRNRQHSTDSETPAVVSPVTELEDVLEDPIAIHNVALEEIVKPLTEEEKEITGEILGKVGDEPKESHVSHLVT